VPDHVEVELLGNAMTKSERLIVDGISEWSEMELAVSVENHNTDAQIQYEVVDAYSGRVIEKGTVEPKNNVFSVVQVKRGDYFIQGRCHGHDQKTMKGSASLEILH
jgi:hypothetical protein